MMPVAVPNRHSRAPIWLLALSSTACALLTGLYVLDSAYSRWAEDPGWLPALNAHNPLILAIWAAWGGSFLLLLIALAVWITNLKERALSQGRLTALVLVLMFSCTSLFLPPASYAALTVLVLGPGKNSERLQYDAVSSDSLLLLDALIVRKADIKRNLLAVASHTDSPRTIARLIRFGVPVDELHPPYNRTALHNAVHAQRYENARLLVGAGARIDIPDIKGLTAVDIAASRKDEEMLRILRSKSAN